MLVDAMLRSPLAETGGAAARAEDEGYDGLWVGETDHEPFLQLGRIADATLDLTIGTSVAIAFARTPMTLATAGYDLAAYSSGRFVLGLGSQVKAHIERRFSMPWSRPAARMREFVLGLRAIWAAWHDGERLAFEGEFYTHTLMTQMFSPPRHEWGPPPVFLAGVGPLMTEVAGEVGDGFFFHPFTTPSYLEEVTLPALGRGRSRAGHDDLDGFVVAGPAFACAGRTDEELATAVLGTKRQIAFYASTPSYRPVLDHHGWGELQPELTALSKQGRWSDMADLIDDDVLATFAVVGAPAEVGAGLRQRWGPLADRISLYATYDHDRAMWPEVIDAIRS